MADPTEVGGWVIDAKNPNRATYTDEDGQTFEAFKQAPTPVQPRGGLERMADSFTEATQHGFPGLVARKWFDWSDKGKNELKQAYPGKPDEWYEEQADKVISTAQAEVRKDMEAKRAADPAWKPDAEWYENVGAIDRWGPNIAGMVLGSAGPESLVNPGAGILSRMGGQAVMGGVSDAVYQAADIVDDVEKEFKVDQVLGSAVAGAALQGVFEIPGFVKGLFKERGVDTTPGTHPEGGTTPMSGMKLSDEAQAEYAQLLDTGTYDDIMRFFDDKNGLKPKPSEVAQWVKAREEGLTQPTSADDIAYTQAGKPVEAEPELDLSQEAELPLGPQAKAMRPKQTPVEPVAGPTPERVKEAHEAAKAHVETLTKDWTNKPDIEVLEHFDDVPDVDLDAIGVTTPEGKVLINMKNVLSDAEARGVTPEDMLSAVTFHEALGHHGLSQKFGNDLDDILGNMYETNKWFKNRTDNWLKDNPGAYDGDVDPTARASEEVLAEMSEAGKIPAAMLDKFKNWLKDYGRQAGLKIDYSKREIKTILGMAHNAVTNGKGYDVKGNGFRYAKVWHGTPAEEKFEKFDHSKMGSGEGAQVYGWGTYLTDSKGIADDFYRERLSGPKAEVAGQKFDPRQDPWGYLGSIEKEFSAQHPDVDHKAAQEALLKWYSKGMDTAPPTAREMVEGLRTPKFLEDRPEFYGPNSVYGKLADFLTKGVKHSGGKGQLLEVEIPDNGKFVLWDKPIAEQPELKEVLERSGFKVASAEEAAKLKDDLELLEGRELDLRDERAKLSARAEKISGTMPQDPTQMAGFVARRNTPEFKDADAAYMKVHNELKAVDKEIRAKKREIEDTVTENTKGGDAYKILSKNVGGIKQASQLLNKAGFDGNKYLTGTARARGGNEFNYVMFDDNTPKITNRYMKKKYQAGTSEGSQQQGSSRREARDDETLADLGVGKIRSNRPIEQIIKDQTPAQQKEHWDDWIEKADKVRGAVKSAKTLKSGSEAPEVLAARKTIVQSANRIHDLSKKLADGFGTPHDEYILFGEIARNAAMQEALAGVRSNAARVVNSFRIEVGSDKALTDSIRNMAALSNNTLLSNAANRKKLIQMMANAKQAGANGAPVNAQINRLANAMFRTKAEDYVFRVWYNMLLSSPVTHIANFVGTGANFAVDLMENTGASVLGHAKGGAFTNADRVRGREVAYRVWGALNALKDAGTWRRTRGALLTGLTGNNINQKGPGGVYVGNNKAVGFASGVLESPTRALAGADEWWRNVLHLSNIYGLAVRNAGNKGLKGQAFWAETDRLINRPTQEMLDATLDYTKVIQFLDKPSAIAQGLLNAQTSTPTSTGPGRAARFLLKAAVPFVKTPDSLIRTSLRRSPLGAFERENVKGWKAGGAERDKVKARLVMSSAIGFWLATEAAKGSITGDGPSQANKRAEWQATHQPNSIKVGDKMYSIKGLEPVSTNILAIATLVERYKAGEISDEDYLKSAGAATTAIAGIITNNSYIENFSALMDIGSGDARTAEGGLINFAAGLASSASTPSILRKMNQTNDPRVVDTTGDGSWQERIVGRVKSGTSASKDLPQKYDTYGRAMLRDFAGPDFYSRTAVKEPEKDEAITELGRLASETDKTIVGPPGKANVNVNGTKRRLTAEEFQNYQHLSGYWIVESVRAELKTPEWKAMSDEEKIKEVKEIVKDMRKSARETLFEESEELDESE